MSAYATTLLLTMQEQRGLSDDCIRAQDVRLFESRSALAWTIRTTLHGTERGSATLQSLVLSEWSLKTKNPDATSDQVFFEKIFRLDGARTRLTESTTGAVDGAARLQSCLTFFTSFLFSQKQRRGYPRIRWTESRSRVVLAVC